MSAVFEENPEFSLVTEVDLPDILAIEESCHAYPWTMGIFRDCIRVGYYCASMKHQNVIQAYGVMSIVAGEAHIFNVAVPVKLRGNGLGEVMMLHLLDQARHGDAKTVFLEVRPSNSVAINLYEKMGFIEVGIRKDYYPNGDKREDAVIMAKEISASPFEKNN